MRSRFRIQPRSSPLRAFPGPSPLLGGLQGPPPSSRIRPGGTADPLFSPPSSSPSPSIMLAGMQGSTLGIWVAHGEGRAYFPRKEILRKVESLSLAPVRYVDDRREPTMKYPFNPNGSANGIAALCSTDGRHLAIMPHPARTFLKWQWAWMPEEWRKNLKASPWLKMVQNARA